MSSSRSIADWTPFLFLQKRGAKHLGKIYIAIVIIDLLLAGGLGWVASIGGKIRHEEFRGSTSLQDTLS